MQEESKGEEKNKQKTIGYTAAYVGKGGHVQKLQGSFISEEKAKRRLRECGVSNKNIRVQAIKE